MKLYVLSRMEDRCKNLRAVLVGKVLSCKCNWLCVLYNGSNSNKIHFVKSSDCLIPHLAVAVTLSLLKPQELYAWMGQLLRWNWGLKKLKQRHLVSLLYLLIAGGCCSVQLACTAQGQQGLPVCLSRLSVRQLWGPGWSTQFLWVPPSSWHSWEGAGVRKEQSLCSEESTVTS